MFSHRIDYLKLTSKYKVILNYHGDHIFLRNVLNALPKGVTPKAKQALHEIWRVKTNPAGDKADDAFVKIYEPKYLKAPTYHF